MRGPQQREMTQLGLYGLIPFVVSAVALWLSPWLLPKYAALDFHQFALVYGGVIVAYLSGIGAGAMLTPKLKHPRGVLPTMLITLAAFFAILPTGTFFLSIGAAWRHFIILLLLIYLLLRDLNNVEAGLLPRWYGALRMRLTLWAGLSIGLIMSRLVFWGHY